MHRLDEAVIQEIALDRLPAVRIKATEQLIDRRGRARDAWLLRVRLESLVEATVACNAGQLFVQRIERTQLPALVQIQCQRAGGDQTQGQRQNFKRWHVGCGAFRSRVLA